MTSVGTVAALYRYPVKSLAAEPLESVGVDWFGVDGDRRYGFAREGDGSDFPWLTIRQVPAMMRYVARCAEDAEQDPPTVVAPDRRELVVTDDALADELAALHGGPIRLLRTFRGLFDRFALTVLSRQTVAGLGALVGCELDPLRFRPTILVDVPGGRYPEDDWIGKTLQIGDGDGALRMRVNLRVKRCMVINFDPETAERDPAVLRAVARHREVCVGVHAGVERPGVLRTGARVWIVG